MRRSRPALLQGLGSSFKSCPSPFANGARVCDSEGAAEHPRAQEAEKEALLDWRRGWDTHPGLFAILACFQQHAENQHKH